MARARSLRTSPRRLRRRGTVGAQVLVTSVALILVVGAAVAATLSATEAGAPAPRNAPVLTHGVSAPSYVGEPVLAATPLSAPSGARVAANRFVRDYLLWSDGRLASIPATDAAAGIIRLLERQGRGLAVSSRVVESLRIGPEKRARCVVTSAVGNFLVGRSGSNWVVVSMPGD